MMIKIITIIIIELHLIELVRRPNYYSTFESNTKNHYETDFIIIIIEIEINIKVVYKNVMRKNVR
jgi:hypothetical protein